MNSVIKGILMKRNISASRGLVLLIDTMFVVLSLLVSLLIISHYDSGVLKELLGFSVVILAVRIVSFLYARTYTTIVRYTGSVDILRIFQVLTVGEIILLAVNGIIYLVKPEWSVSYLFFWIEYSLLLCLMVFGRLVFRVLFVDSFQRNGDKKVIVYGDSKYLLQVKHVILNDHNQSYSICAFVGTDSDSVGKMLGGVRVYGIKDLEMLLKNKNIDSMIIAQNKKPIKDDDRDALINACINYKVKIKEIPQPEDLIKGKFTLGQLRNLRIEDLLQRDVIMFDQQHIESHLKGKVIMVTGAGGSIGSEIVRQLTAFMPLKIILVDIAESALYDLELELEEKLSFADFAVEMTDVRNKVSMEQLFQKHHPYAVFHAAAYKHVPMIENKPLEGVYTNIIGTSIVADLADKYECAKFVMVSTDKAVNPTNVMGCTKRIAEIYIQALNQNSKTSFITTRFGNVLGSNGSVVPRFLKQIEDGGPITVTHPEITRFFMTIPEACQLVLQAAVLGNGGEIFVFDMGESVKIVDLAKKMIRLSGLEEFKDVDIVFTGLRPGEKLYEEVLNQEEEVLPTLHNRIHRAKVREYDFREVVDEIERFWEIVREGGSEVDAVRKMKEIVPEFWSRNSRFEALDKELEGVS